MTVFKAFVPEIVQDFTMPTTCKTNAEEIQISHSPDDINGFYSCILQDQERQFEKQRNIQPKYFKEGLEFVDTDAIIRIDKIVSTFEAETEVKDIKKALKKCVVAINKLDDKLNFITTIEAEDLFTKLVKLAVKLGLTQADATTIVDQSRMW